MALTYIIAKTISMKRSSLIALSIILSVQARSQTIMTIAGMGQGTRIDSVAATASGLGVNYGKCITGPEGNLYIADGTHNVVRMVDKNTGIIYTIAGNGSDQYMGDGGPATDAQFDDLKYIAFGPAGDLYISDEEHHRVRVVNMQTGIVTTFAGDGGFTFNGDGVPATSSSLASPTGLAFLQNGDLVIADKEMNRIRRVSASNNIITTICGNGTGTNTGDGGPAIDATINMPEGICTDSADNIYIALPENDLVRMINATTGIITTIAGNGTGGYSGDGGPASLAQLNGPCDVAADKNGHLYIADNFNHVVRRVNGLGILGNISTVAGNGMAGFSGDGGPATAAKMDRVAGISVDSCDNLYISDRINRRVRRVTYNNCNLLAVNMVTASRPIAVYPNPASSMLTISSGEQMNELTIYDVTGRIVLQKSVNSEQSTVNSDQVTVDVTGLLPGIYFVRIKSDLVKFILQ